MNVLRDYQRRVLDEALVEFASSRSVMVTMATGAGKTGVAAEFARDHGQALFLCHTRAVLDQVPSEFGRWGLDAVVVGGSHGARDWSNRSADVVAATPAFASNRLNHPFHVLEGRFGCLIVDEAHHAADPLNEGSKSRTTQLIEYFRSAGKPVLGLTATPARMSSRQGFSKTWDKLVIGPEWDDLRGEYLADVLLLVKGADDWIVGAGASVESNRDYTAGATYTKNEGNPIFTAGVFEALERAARLDDGGLKKTIIYAVSRKHAAVLAGVASGLGIDCGILVSGIEDFSEGLLDSQDGDGEVVIDQDEVVARMRDGRLRVVINVNKITEGFDLPDAEVIICARPTQSIPLWRQMCGRASRLAEGKTRAVIVDLTDNHRRLGDPLMRYDWTLDAVDTPPGQPRMRTCLGKYGSCGALIHTGHHHCPSCQRAQGKDCEVCGRHRLWKSFGRKRSVCVACEVEYERLQAIFRRRRERSKALAGGLLQLALL